MPHLKNTIVTPLHLRSTCLQPNALTHQVIWYWNAAIKRCWCTCPQQGNCEHIAASLLCWTNTPSYFEYQRADLHDTLALLESFEHLTPGDFADTYLSMPNGGHQLRHFWASCMRANHIERAVWLLGGMDFDALCLTMPDAWIMNMADHGFMDAAIECAHWRVGHELDKKTSRATGIAVVYLVLLRQLYARINRLEQWQQEVFWIQTLMARRPTYRKQAIKHGVWLEVSNLPAWIVSSAVFLAP